MTMSIQEVALRTGLTAHTLRYYESAGLVPGVVRRNGAGHRVYDDSDVEWFEICSSLRRSGMPIATLRTYADLVRAGVGTEAQRLQLLRAHRDRLDDQLARLGAARELVTYKIDCYQRSLEEGTAHHLDQALHDP